jgi:hypothetical protein
MGNFTILFRKVDCMVSIRFTGSQFATGVRILGALGLVSSAGAALALKGYVGNSYLQIPGVEGSWVGTAYTNSLKIDAHYWGVEGPLTSFHSRGANYSGANGQPGKAGTLVLALKKNNPDLPALMRLCRQQKSIPALTYAESAPLNRYIMELGPKPASVPDYFEYKLRDVAFSECPIVKDAREQALVLKYSDLEWLNYEGDGKPVPVDLKPAMLAPKSGATGQSKAFVVTWFGYAHDVSADQCSAMNDKPSQDEYFKYMSAADAKRERAALVNTGVNYQSGQMGRRGPNKLDVSRLPGIVLDPGHAEPQSKIARGINLDGRDDPEDFVAADGRTGIDNQLYRVKACTPAWTGRTGFRVNFVNSQMRDGLFTMLIEVSGIDDEQNDDSVDITWLYSKDKMSKDASGKRIIHHSSFRVSEEPEYTHYFARMRGRIVDNVILAEPEEFELNLSIYGVPVELRLIDPGLRLQIMPDGTLSGIVGGYRDWREVMGYNMTSGAEAYFGYTVPGLYNSLIRNADGMKDPETGEYLGISTAYEVEGVPAFVVGQPDQLVKMDMKKNLLETGR